MNINGNDDFIDFIDDYHDQSFPRISTYLKIISLIFPFNYCGKSPFLVGKSTVNHHFQ
jgi:hypothetical protein